MTIVKSFSPKGKMSQGVAQGVPSNDCRPIFLQADMASLEFMSLWRCNKALQLCRLRVAIAEPVGAIDSWRRRPTSLTTGSYGKKEWFEVPS